MKIISFVCKICGSPHIRERNGKLYCLSCGEVFERVEEDSESREARILYLSRLDNAEKQLTLSLPRFDDAEDYYREFIKQYPHNSDGYWGLVRAKYGIKYETDISGRMIPSCYKSDYEDFRSDPDFRCAVELAESERLREKYIKEADEIAAVYAEWKREADKYDYDVFLSFKDEDRTRGISDSDRRVMHSLYELLSGKGYKVFFSPVTMKEFVGRHYDAYIFNALQKAKVMIVYGSRPEYFETTWVENEWTRFLRLISDGKKKKGSLIVAYEGFNPVELPRPLRVIQGIDASDKNELQETAVRVVEGMVEKRSTAPVAGGNAELDFEVKAGELKRYRGQSSQVVIPDGIHAISAEAFSDCKAVRTVIIPEGVRSIGKRAFLGCVALESVKLPMTLEKIEDLSFSGCVRLEEIAIPEGVTHIGKGAFEKCRRLRIDVHSPDDVYQWDSGWNCKRPVFSYSGKLKEVKTETFRDTEAFGRDGIWIKRFILYGDNDMAGVFKDASAIFNAVGGPLEDVFSSLTDKKHLTASHINVEDGGISGTFGINQIIVGSADYMKGKGVAISDDSYSRNDYGNVAVMYVAKNNSLCAKLYIGYPFSESFLSTLARLRAKKTVPVITTCDPNVTNDLLRALVGAEGASEYAPKVRRILGPK